MFFFIRAIIAELAYCMGIMKVSKTRTSSAAPAKRALKTEAADGTAFADHLSGVNKSLEHTPLGEVSRVMAVGSILTAQEVGEDNGQKSRHLVQKYGEDILDRLDEIQRDLLVGAISKDRLTSLAQTLRRKKSTIDDPSLLRIIKDIELRAEIELAKYTRSL
ncbi:MAG: flagellar assembly protein FliX [Rhodospirillales bacterium]